METNFGMSAQVVTQKICDISLDENGKPNNPDIKTSGSVIIKPTREWIERTPSSTFHCSRDPKTGIFYGIPVAKNTDGSVRFRKMTIIGHRHFNLDNIQDAVDFYIFKHAPFMKDTPCPAPGFKPTFYIEDAEAESEMKLDKKKMAMNLNAQIFNMSEIEVRHWGILYGIDPLHNTPEMIKLQLLESAEINPAAMKERFENKERTAMHTLLKRAMRIGVVTYAMDKGYLFKNGITMGNNETAAVDKMMMDKDFAFNLNSEVEIGERDFVGKEKTSIKKLVKVKENKANKKK